MKLNVKYRITWAIYFFVALSLTACSFDKLFLVPTVSEPGASNHSVISKNTGDTTFVTFDKDRNPIFLDDSGPTEFSFDLKNIQFESKSGNTLTSWLLLPKNDHNGITLVFFHGNAGNVLLQSQLAFPFVERGYKILLVDYSGFGNSTGQATRDNVLLDGYSAVEYALQSEELKSEKLVIYGQSLGGHLAIPVALEYQDDIDGVVIEGAFSSHQDIAAKRAWILARIFVAEKYSAKKTIQKLHKPVLIIHSREDETIPFKMGEKLYEKANQPKEFYPIDKCHICGPIYYADSIDAKIKMILQE
ncbi:MAG: alpha/beta hydrolase [Crocinitomicaceae bacterium]|nr:alpha/beta hydrolase [Crocinitomicaceae bacterium]